MKRFLSVLLVLCMLLTGMFTSTAATEDGGQVIATNEAVVNETVADEAVESDLNDAAYSPELNLYIAVGDGGNYSISQDGKTWSKKGSIADANLKSIAWNGQKFVVSTDSGMVLISLDGSQWVKKQITNDVSLNKVIWDNEKFIAVGSGKEIFISYDGEAWQAVASNNQMPLNDVAKSPTMYMAVGDNGTVIVADKISAGLVWKPADLASIAVTGTDITIDKVDFNGVECVGDTFIAVGTYGVYLSTKDGINWSAGIIDKEADYVDIKLCGNNIVAVGSNGSMAAANIGSLVPVSTTATTGVVVTTPVTIVIQWVILPVVSSNIYRLNSILFVNGYIIVVGSFNTILYTTDPYAPWIFPWPPYINYHLNDVEWSPQLSRYVAVGTSGRILTSSDGRTWTVRASNTRVNLNGIAWSALRSRFVVVGDRGIVLNSSDGINWTVYNTNLYNRFMNVCWDGSYFITVGSNGCILRSSTGTTWGYVPSFANYYQTLNDVIYNGTGVRKTAGTTGNIGTSTDGVTWSADTVYSSNTLNDLAYSPEQSRYVAVGQSPGTILYSSGTTNRWYSRSMPFGLNRILNGVVWKYVNQYDYYFTTVGSSGTIMVSPDGFNWSVIYSPTARTLNDITWSPNQNLLVAVGEYERIVVSTNGINWSVVR